MRNEPSAGNDKGLTEQTLVERILMLETANVGCRPGCICRAYAAAIMSDAQAEKLKAHVANLATSRADSNERVVKDAIGAEDDEELPELLDKIARDRDGASHESIKGGEAGARNAIGTLSMALAMSSLTAAQGPLIIRV